MGWELSKESFYRVGWLPFLRLSATYGVSGNVDLTKTALPVGNTSVNSIIGFKDERINEINNPDLTWERSYQANVRLDFAAAGNNITGSVEYYRKKGTDLYAPTPYDYTTWGGSNTITANVADMKGKGVDVTLHSNNFTGRFTWATDFLFNYNTSVTTAYYASTAESLSSFIGHGNSITPVIGKPLYAIAAYKWGGLDKQGNPQGYIGDTLSEDYTAISNNSFDNGLKGGSFVYIGPANPVYFGSLMNSFSFNGLELSFNIIYKLHYYLFRPALNYYSLANNGINGMDYDNRWQHPGDETKTNVPSFVYPLNANRDAFYDNSQVNVIKGDHIRLQFINLAYSFLHNKRNLPFKSLQVYVNAANLGIIWRANKYHIDPDYVDAIPDPKIYTLGIRADF